MEEELFDVICKENITRALELIDQDGIDLNFKHPTYDLNTFLHASCMIENGFPITHKLLLKGCNPNIKNDWERTPLSTAVINGFYPTVNLLLDFGADVNLNLASDMTVLFHLRNYTTKEAIVTFQRIIEKTKNINKQNKHGETALHHAAKYNIFLISRLFLQNGANPFIQNNKGETPYKLAMMTFKRKTRLLFKNFVKNTNLRRISLFDLLY